MSTLGNVLRSEQSQLGQTLHRVRTGLIEHAGVAEQLIQNRPAARAGLNRRIDRSRGLGEFVVGFGGDQCGGRRTAPLRDDQIDNRLECVVGQ